VGRAQARLALTVALAAAVFACGGAAATDHNTAGRAAYAQGDYAKAERMFRDGVAAAPRDPVVRHHLAIALVRLGQWEEARAQWEQVLRMSPPPDVMEAARAGLRTFPRPRAQAPDIGVPIAPGRGGWVTEVTINGRYRGRFLVDTGAALCVITPQTAEALALGAGDIGEDVHLQTVSGLTRASGAVLKTVTIGTIEARNVRAVIHPLDGFDGILGNTLLDRYTLTLDTAQRRLVLRAR